MGIFHLPLLGTLRLLDDRDRQRAGHTEGLHPVRQIPDSELQPESALNILLLELTA